MIGSDMHLKYRESFLDSVFVGEYVLSEVIGGKNEFSQYKIFKATPHNSDCANLLSDFSSNKPN